MALNAVTQYSLKLMIGGKNFSNYLSTLRISISRETALQLVYLDLNLNREQYNQYLAPYKDNIKLEIASSTGISSDLDPPNVDASFSYELSALEEKGQQGNTSAPEGTSPSSPVTIVCVSRKQFRAYQKLIKNEAFIDKTRPQMIEKIMSGIPYELQSEIYKPKEVIEQVFLPPLRQVAAIKHLDFYLKLFEGALPTYINYCIDGKTYIGSCVKNKMEPLKLLHESNSILHKAGDVATKKSKEYDYLVIQAIQEAKPYNSLCAALGRNQSYCFSPMHKLYSRLEKNLNEFSDKTGLRNVYGDDPVIGTHVKRTIVKDTWFKTHNGLPDVEDPEDNIGFAEGYISYYNNQAVMLSMKVDGAIKFKDFLMVGRKVHLTCNSNALKYNGDYFLDSATLSFSSAGPYWTGHAFITIKSSLKLSNT